METSDTTSIISPYGQIPSCFVSLQICFKLNLHHKLCHGSASGTNIVIVIKLSVNFIQNSNCEVKLRSGPQPNAFK